MSLQYHALALKFAAIWLIAFAVAIADEPDTASKSVIFTRDIQPILATHCWSCHGPDEKTRAAELRLDLRESAIDKKAIVPQKPEESLLIQRIHSADPEEVMPPPSTKKQLTEQQKKLLEQWINEDAQFAGHWAFQPIGRPTRPSPTAASGKSFVIDAIVSEELTKHNLSSAPQADKATLLRRVTLDLTGLPPTTQELNDFVQDTSPDAYRRVVDRLLSSKAYAERMAAQWLDLARYADTNGYNNDEDRTMWPWRDWVIQAFDRNMPYDRFLLEQLAGDLLPNPTQDQLIATAFLRNQGHNTEGGIIQEEYRIEYVADRVHTTATVFLGLSLQCARCHDHKYDPITQKEYYSFFALLNNLDERQASYSKFVAAEPFIRVPSPEQRDQLASLDKKLSELKAASTQREEVYRETFTQWLEQQAAESLESRFGLKMLHDLSFNQIESKPDNGRRLDSLHPDVPTKVVGQFTLVAGHAAESIQFDGASHVVVENMADFDGQSPFSIVVWVYPEADGSMAVLSKMDEAAAFRGYDLLLENGKVVSHLIHRWPDNALKVSTKETLQKGKWQQLTLVYDGSRKAAGIKIYIDGKLAALDANSDSLTDTISTAKPFHIGLRERSLPFLGRVDALQIFSGALQLSQVQETLQGKTPASIAIWIRNPAEQWTPEQQEFVKQFTLTQLDQDYVALKQQLTITEQERTTLLDQFPAVMVMKEMQPPRETFLLNRGQYDQPTEKIGPNVPAVLRSFTNLSPRNRLELAQWLTHPAHPLTARVAVNRFWENFFGIGLVKTSEDFGTTGEFPSHPELLDFLAMHFVDSGWDVKELQRLIVLSETYQQDSRITSDHLTKDPENRWLSRGPRYRLSAETIRDNALAVAGLLQPRVGGASVKPYQPEGLWEDVTVERRGKYIADQGEGLFRRSMYTFWKRTCPPPSMVSFDAPNREVCVARRSRTNTPLQSLVLLNDPTYVEAARSLAQLMMAAGGEDKQRIDDGLLRAVARPARPEELAILTELLASSRDRFAKDPTAAEKLNAVGTIPLAQNSDPCEVAAWTVVASTILNLDETISKR